MICSQCDYLIDREIEIDFKFFICPSCFALHKFSDGLLAFKNMLEKPISKNYLDIGKSIVFENENYCIANFIVKTCNPYEYWSEYELVSHSGKKIYVVEENGHWIISKEVVVKKDSKSEEIYHDNIDFKLFEKGTCTDQSGAGFFDYKLSNKVFGFRDYINPPNVLSVEIEDNETIYYFGTHYSNKEIKELFGIEILPAKENVGIVQPFYFNIYKIISVFSCASIIILILHLIFYQNAKNQVVYQNKIDLTTQIDIETATNVFELNGPIAPLNIIIETNVNDSWLATDFSLVNQTTGEVAYFSKDVELYSGYEGGESWTEGSRTEEFNICGVSSGKYKIFIKPTKDIADVYNNEMLVAVYWNKSNNWNFMLALLTFLVIVIIIYALQVNFETKRWFDSDYSPYNKEK